MKIENFWLMSILQPKTMIKSKLILISFMLLGAFNLTYSQVQVGLKYDINGIPFNGYFDPFTYSPDKKVTQIHYSDSYEKGAYYDSLGNKIEGLIKFEDRKIFFKNGKKESSDKIKPETVKSFVIGVDSFISITNFYFKDKLKTKPEFAQYITEFEGNTFVKHYHFSDGMAQKFGESPIIETFLVKSKDGQNWENFYDSKRFKDVALKYFSYIPYLKEKIESGKYDSKSMLSVIKMAEYYSNYQKSIPIYYDSYWQEVRDAHNSKYYAKITDKRDSIWTFDYYLDKIKLFTANYSSFYPNVKNGEFISYYPDGTKRQIIFYLNNKLKEVKLFDKLGVLYTHYKFIEKGKTEKDQEVVLKYEFVADSAGNNIIKSSNKIVHKVFDSFNNITYYNTYRDSLLINSYYLLDKDTVFLFTNSKLKYKVNSLQTRFTNYIATQNYDEALSQNAQGIVLVSLVIDKKGFIVKGKAINSIHPVIDNLVDNFIRFKLRSKDFPYKFKPYTIGKTKQFCELVLPIDFTIYRYYRQPINYYYFNNYFFDMQLQRNIQMQMQRNQQMMMNRMNNMRMSAPSFNGRF
jgi:hypothetical protein